MCQNDLPGWEGVQELETLKLTGPRQLRIANHVKRKLNGQYYIHCLLKIVCMLSIGFHFIFVCQLQLLLHRPISKQHSTFLYYKCVKFF